MSKLYHFLWKMAIFSWQQKSPAFWSAAEKGQVDALLEILFAH